MIENHAYEQLLEEHVLDHTKFSRHVLTVYIFLVAYYLKLQIEAVYSLLPLIKILQVKL